MENSPIVSVGEFAYRTTEHAEWIIMEDAPSPRPRSSNAKITLDGRITLMQNVENTKVTLVLGTEHYAGQDIKSYTPSKLQILPDIEGGEEAVTGHRKDYSSVWTAIYFEVTGSGHITTTGATASRDPKTYPLYTVASQLRYVRFSLFNVNKVKDWNMRKALTFLTGATTWSASSNADLFIQQQLEAVRAEADATLQRLTDTTGCIVRARQHHKRVILLIYPPEDIVELENLFFNGQRIYISNDGWFTSKNAEQNPSRDSGLEGVWVARVLLGLHEAPVCAVLQHPTPQADMLDWIELEEYNCKIEPDTYDVTRERAEDATGRHEWWFEAEEQDDIREVLQGCPMDKWSGLPNKKIFLDEGAVTDDDPLVPSMSAVPFPADMAHATGPQKQAIQMVFDKIVSTVQGPPGTGKTTTIILLLEALLRHTKKTILVCAPTHAAVEELVIKTVKRRREGNFKFPFTHVLSHVQAEAKMTFDTYQPHRVGVSPLALINRSDPAAFQLHNQCRRLAEEVGPRGDDRGGPYGDFANGFDEICRTGTLISRKAYNTVRKKVEARVLGDTRVVFCTCAAAGLFFLAENFQPGVLILDEGAATKPYELMIPLASHVSILRLAMFGDPAQLAATTLTRLAQGTWHVSPMEKLMADGWPQTMLTDDFRRHTRLSLPSSATFYDNQVRAIRATIDPRPFLANFRSKLPIRIRSADGTSFTITSYAHFIDVRNSECFTVRGGSSRNPAEAAAVNSIIGVLLKTGAIKDPSDILGLSGYRDQRSALRNLAAESGWAGIKVAGGGRILTVKSAQGHEANAVMASYTRVGADHGHMSSPRLINVMTSRAAEVQFIFGDLNSVLRQSSKDRPLKKYVTYQMEAQPDYVIHAGNAPYGLASEDGDFEPIVNHAASIHDNRGNTARELYETVTAETQVLVQHEEDEFQDDEFKAWTLANRREQELISQAKRAEEGMDGHWLEGDEEERAKKVYQIWAQATDYADQIARKFTDAKAEEYRDRWEDILEKRQQLSRFKDTVAEVTPYLD